VYYFTTDLNIFHSASDKAYAVLVPKERKTMTHVGSTFLGVFSDEVFTSTELARRTSDVLNTAKERPVTVSRNQEQFALIRRDAMATLISKLTVLQSVVDIQSEIGLLLAGEKPSETYSWLEVFEKEDLQKMSAEILGAARQALIGRGEWQHIGKTMHEWEESAGVAKSCVLDRAMFAPEEKLRIPPPTPDLGVRTEMDEADSLVPA
jgi:hypothetical protein